MLVLDASAAVDYLLCRGDRGEWVADRMAGLREIAAPALLDLEVTAAFRSMVRRRMIDSRRARIALVDLASLPARRYPHGGLVDRAWELRDSMTVYDAAYVALAEALDLPLVTTDARLGRATGHRAMIEAYSG
jgi:predicted nucleic acid-binding protein